MKHTMFTALMLAGGLMVSGVTAVSAHAEELPEENMTDVPAETSPEILPPVCLAPEPGEVPRIYLTTKNGNGLSLVKKDGYTEAQVQIIDTDGSILELPCTVKVRGNTTSVAPKKAYTFKLEKKQDLFGMGAAKKWALLANCFDPTMLRNSLALDLGKELGLSYTSEHRVTEVWMDGKYLGCYDLTEPVEVKPSRVELETDGEQDFMLEYESKRVEADALYLLVGDWRFRIDEPETPSDAQTAHMRSVISNAQAALKSGDFNRVEACMDVDSFAKLYLVNEYFKTVDFGFSSVYFYCKDGMLYAGPVWDFDLSAGNVNPGYNANYKRGSQPTGLNAADKHFYAYLFKYDTFRERLSDIYFEHYSYMEQISAPGGQIDSLAAQYDSVFQRNYAEGGWQITKTYNELMRKPESTYQKNLDFLRNYLAARNTWLADHYGVFEGCTPGDVNNDGSINASDASLILIAAAKLGTGEPSGLSAKQHYAANVNSDADINASDASVVLIYAAARGAGHEDAVLNG